eukprot:m.214122 g.214122  ORF g.214122 m.214122 type:complete len:194 (+) comp13797_c1_seq6:1605-2186(+)
MVKHTKAPVVTNTIVLPSIRESSTDDDNAPTKAGECVAPKCQPKEWASPNTAVFKLDLYDLFERVGPITFFNSTSPIARRITLTVPKEDDNRMGFTIAGGEPCCIDYVNPDSAASLCGIISPCYLLAVNGVDVRWFGVEEVLEVIKRADSPVRVTLVYDQWFGGRNSPACISMTSTNHGSQSYAIKAQESLEK